MTFYNLKKLVSNLESTLAVGYTAPKLVKNPGRGAKPSGAPDRRKDGSTVRNGVY